ncbi:hypothetical protein LTR17_020221 [Elasticomyces elasticus]|nr:hypothetical protein LTR17_020221 [Elasticomyces elasticus]
MSGAEAIGIVGLIASVITIFETCRDLHAAATNVEGLHEAFLAISNNIPLVLNILQECKRMQEQADQDYKTSTDDAQKRRLAESAAAVRPIMIACERNAQSLKDIFEEVISSPDANWLERYRKAVRANIHSKRRKVEDLMTDILRKLQLLHTNQFFKLVADKRSQELEAAIQQLAELPPSLPDDDSRYMHSGSGPMNINPGSGTMRNYNFSGGSNNKMFNAETQNFGKD